MSSRLKTAMVAQWWSCLSLALIWSIWESEVQITSVTVCLSYTGKFYDVLCLSAVMCSRVQTRPPPFRQLFFCGLAFCEFKLLSGLRSLLNGYHALLSFLILRDKVCHFAALHFQSCQLIWKIGYFHSYAPCNFLISLEVVLHSSWLVLQSGAVRFVSLLFCCCMLTKLRWFLRHELL